MTEIKTIFSEKTLVPVKLIIALITGVVGITLFVVNLYFSVDANTKGYAKHEAKIEGLVSEMNIMKDDYKQQISKMREDLNAKLNEIIITLTKITTTLEKTSPKELTFDP